MFVGDFTPEETTDPEAEPDTFSYFGETFEVPPTIGSGSLLQFTWQIKEADSLARRGETARRKALTEEKLQAARGMEVEAELAASAAVYMMLRSTFGEHQMPRLLATVDANGVQAAGLMELCNAIQEVIANRPTRRSVVSSAGPSISGDGSTDAGYSTTEQPDWGTPPSRPRPPQRPSVQARTSTGTPRTFASPREQQMAMIEAASVPVG